MRALLGQAAGHGARIVHVLARMAFMLGLLVVVATLALAWRLSQGPIALNWLVDQLEAAANGGNTASHLRIGHAALAWEGFKQGIDRPIDLVLSDIAVVESDGKARAALPYAALSLSFSALLAGEIVPRAIELRGLHLRGTRARDGTFELDLGSLTETIDAADAPGLNATAGLTDAIALLSGRLGAASATLPRWRALSRVRLRDASATMVDHAIGVTWQVPALTLDVRRAARGGASAQAHLLLDIGDQRVGLDVHAALPPGGQRIGVTAHASPIVLSSLASAAPAFAGLAAIDAPIDLSGTASLGGALDITDIAVIARLGEGHIHLASGLLPVRSAIIQLSGIQLSGTPMAFDIAVPHLELAAHAGAPVSVVGVHGTVRLADAMLTAKLGITMDKLAFADLGDIWPDGAGGKGTKKWLTENITAGIAHDLDVAIELQAPADLSAVTVTALSGGLQGSDLTVHWLRPIPPAEHGVATLRFLGPDALAITVKGGQQSGTGIKISGGKLVISGLSVRDQVADMSADLAGPAADLIGILQNKRLHLFDTRPIEMRAPTGQISGRLVITALPLEDFLTVEMIKLHGVGQATDLHLGGVAGGRDLDHGALSFDASNEGLKLRGTADLAGIPTSLQVDMDFRPGGPSQVIQKVTVKGSVAQPDLVRLGLDPGDSATGSAAGQAEWTSRRNGRGEITLRADLTNAALSVPRLNFTKPTGRAATLDARLQLDKDRITGLDRLMIAGNGIDVQAQVEYALGRPQVLRLQRLKFGPVTDLTGDVLWPRRDGDPWSVRISGAGLDGSGEFGTHGSTTAAPAREAVGPPWTLDAHLDRVLMGAGRMVYGVATRISNDGHITRQARVSGRTTAAAGNFQIDIDPTTAGRALRGTAEDAGGLLAALDVIDQMRGGKLTLSGSYDDSKSSHPLSGTAEIANFRMHDAPGLAKLLQAITVYGLFDVVQSADLGFNSLTAPFRMTGDILEVQDARAFSASLGITGKGRLDLARRVADGEGTVVPAYFLNSLLGRIPLLGNLLSAEKGGGLLAIGFSVRGPFDDPSVRVNPLTAVTPGFLRGLFDVFDGAPTVPAPGQPAPPPAKPRGPAAAGDDPTNGGR